MTKDDFIELEKIVRPDEKIKLRVLYDAMVSTLKDYKSHYSQANLKAWQAAENALHDFADNIRESQEKQFNTIKKVVLYIQSYYPTAVQSTIYNHCKKGILKKNTNDKFNKRDVDEYIRTHIKKNIYRDGEDLDSVRKKQILVSTEKKRYELDIIKGNYISNEEHDRQLCELLIAIKDIGENWVYEYASELIRAAQTDEWDVIKVAHEGFKKYLSRLDTDRKIEVLIEKVGQN